MEVRELPIDEIVLDPTLNLRDRLDEETVERYAESWEDLPPVAVFEVDGQWLLADGFHRHAAFVARERPKIPAHVHAGGFDDALAFAALANLKHGLPLRRQERRRVVEVRLRMAPESSDRQLARELGVSRDLVARVRSDLVGAGQIDRVEGRVGADGKVYPSQGLPRDPNEGLPKTSTPAAPRAAVEDATTTARTARRPGTTPAPSRSPRRRGSGRCRTSRPSTRRRLANDPARCRSARRRSTRCSS